MNSGVLKYQSDSAGKDTVTTVEGDEYNGWFEEDYFGNRYRVNGRVIRPPQARVRSDAELAKVTANRLHLEALKELDPEAWDVVRVIVEVEQFNAKVRRLNLSKDRTPRISKHMLRHLDSMIAAGIVDRAEVMNLEYVMPVFTVEKRSGGLRLISDCRKFNADCSRPPPMNLPRIGEVVDSVMACGYCATSDGVSWFYQFEMAASLRRCFGAALVDERGNPVYIHFKSMPMGWSWAPAIGQAAGAALTRGIGQTWVDNFFVIGNSREQLLERIETFKKRARLLNAEYSPIVIHEGEFSALGLEFDLVNRRWRLDQKFVEKVSTISMSTEGEYFRLLGSLVWGAYAMRRPLTRYHDVLSAAGKALIAITADNTWSATPKLSDSDVALVNDWKKQVVENAWRTWEGRSEPTCVVLSDASDTHRAYFVVGADDEVQGQGQSSVTEKIFVEELLAAAEGIHSAAALGHKSIAVVIDNMAAKLALEHGYSTNRLANKIIADLPSVDLLLAWTPSEYNLADPHTRGVPLPRKGSTATDLRNIHRDFRRTQDVGLGQGRFKQKPDGSHRTTLALNLSGAFRTPPFCLHASEEALMKSNASNPQIHPPVCFGCKGQKA